MDGKINVLIRGKPELTRKRLQVDNLLKRAMKGNNQAKSKLYNEFGIRLYSTDEVKNYVQKMLTTEVIGGPSVKSKAKSKTKVLPKRKLKLVAKKG
jgi:hypothetical protein